MAEAFGFVRRQCRMVLADLIAAELGDGVAVSRNQPREFSDQLVWLADTTGSVNYPAMGNNLPRDDIFTVVVVCQSHMPGDSPDEAEERVESYAAAVMAAVSVAPTTYDPLGGGVDGLIMVTVANVDGPDSVPAAEGYGAIMAVSVEFHTRIVLP